MESALAWIGKIAEWVGQFFPRWIILDTTEGAVKFTGFLTPRPARRLLGLLLQCGHTEEDMRVTVCGPGIHWYWPATTNLQDYPTARQADNLPTQTVVTADDKTIAVGGMLVYQVEDLGLLLGTTHSAIKVVQDVALTAIHDVCCELTWEELKMGQRKGTLNTKLKNACQKQLGDYGVKVIKCMLTDLAPTRVLKLIQATQVDE